MAEPLAVSVQKARELLLSVLEGTMEEASRLGDAYMSTLTRAEVAAKFEDSDMPVNLATENRILAYLCQGLIGEINSTNLIDRIMGVNSGG